MVLFSIRDLGECKIRSRGLGEEKACVEVIHVSLAE
jgi:hypothetical protein